MVNAAGFPVYFLDPNARKDYGVNWTDFLAGDTLFSSTWIVPAGLTHIPAENSFTTTVAVLWLSGGVVGTRYTVVNHIVTLAGRQEDQSLEIVCRHK